MTLLKSCFAQEEARLIGVRTKTALRQAKLRGVKLGVHNPIIEESARKGRERKGKATLERLAPIFLDLLNKGITSAPTLAIHLNGMGVKSASGRPWTRQTALAMKRRVLESV